MNRTSDAIWAMCVRAIAPWLSRKPVYAEAVAEYERYNQTRSSLFLLRLENGTVRILDKPRFYTREQLDTQDSPLLAVWAANKYRDFLGEVAATSCPDIDVVLAIDLEDGGFASDTAPIFVIQKLAGSSSVLLPHHEFILTGFHEACRDEIAYRDKSLQASFIGATTGGGDDISVDSVRNLGFPRLRSAMYFKNHPFVDFRLTKIVQCSPEAEQLLREMGFGTGERKFEEQFVGKFIIAIDGNAGTCSRVTMCLKSNCVPLIYHSPHMMHYFNHLVPWLHYVPIGSDPEVESILELERRYPGFFEYVARAGTSFFENYLTKERIMHYTASLIRLYAGCFEQPLLCSWQPDEDLETLNKYSAMRLRERMEALEAEMTALRSSRSWRLTAPIRALHRRWQQLRFWRDPMLY